MRPMATSTHTETGAGPVPHKVVRMCGLTFRAPVKLERSTWRSSLPHPLKEFGRYVYALPCGAEVRG